MPSAWVTCQACKILVVFKTEHWRGQRAFCKKCYDDGREAETAKVLAKLDKASGIKTERSDKPAKKTAPASKALPKNTPDRCETCSGAEERCKKCGGMLCRPKGNEACEQRRHGKICLDCYEKLL
jgi:hypothetical protein